MYEFEKHKDELADGRWTSLDLIKNNPNLFLNYHRVNEIKSEERGK